MNNPRAAAVATVAATAIACVSLPPWSATHAISPHYIFAYALAVMLLWVPVLRLIRPTLTITEPLVFATLASGLLALSQAHHANMLLLAHAGLFTLATLCSLGRFARYGAALQFYAALGVYGYATSFLLRAIILN